MDLKKPLDYATPTKSETPRACGLGIVGLIAAITAVPFAVDAYQHRQLVRTRSYYLDGPAAQILVLLTGAMILAAVVLGVLSICKARRRARTGWVALAIAGVALVILVRGEMLVR